MHWLTELLEKLVHSEEMTNPFLFYTTRNVLIEGEDMVWSDSFFKQFVEYGRQKELGFELSRTDRWRTYPKQPELEEEDV